MTSTFLPVPAVIARIDRTVPDNHLFGFVPETVLTAAPGQFVELSVHGVGAFPVSAAGAGRSDLFEACIRRAGRVTSALYHLREGDAVGLRGPFGNGFPLQGFAGRNVLLVAGGLGIAPLRGLLKKLLARRDHYGEISLLYGSRTPETLLFKEELEALAEAELINLRFSVDFATELPWRSDAYICQIGLVTELLEGLHFKPENTVAAVCGPPSLYGCVLEQLAAAGIDAESIFATLERRMKCGLGQCCHCICAGVAICRQGPVFSLAQLRTMPGAI